MRPFAIIFLIALTFLLGCQSSSVVDKTYQTSQDRLQHAYSAVIPLPETTPFDFDSAARTAYLSAYQDGYRSGLTQLNILFGRPREGFATYNTARTQGWEAGAKAGFSNSSKDPLLNSTNHVQDNK